MPPAFTHNHLHIRSGRGTQWEDDVGVGRGQRRENVLNVQVGASVIDQTGVAVCHIASANRSLDKCLFIHRRNVTEEQPVYLEEAAVLHGFRATHGWTREPQERREDYSSINMRARDENARRVLSNWLQTGRPCLRSLIASPLAEDPDRLEHWLKTDLWLRPFETRTSLGEIQSMSWRSNDTYWPPDILVVWERFRVRER